MKILNRTGNSFNFDNGAWVGILIGDNGYGSWEYQWDADDEETYSEGGLWFDEDKVLEDYDGCYELPEEVVLAIKELGYKTE